MLKFSFCNSKDPCPHKLIQQQDLFNYEPKGKRYRKCTMSIGYCGSQTDNRKQAEAKIVENQGKGITGVKHYV